jgi:hypothetical protein
MIGEAIYIGSVYSYNNFQQIVVRIAVNLILTTNDITESIQWGNKFLFKIANQLPFLFIIEIKQNPTNLFNYFIHK